MDVFHVAPGPSAPLPPGLHVHDSCFTWNTAQWWKVLSVPVALLLITFLAIVLWFFKAKIYKPGEVVRPALMKRKTTFDLKMKRSFSTHLVFWSNVRQALTIGVWVAVVGLPIYTEAPRRHFFGVEKCGDISGFAYAHKPHDNQVYVSHFKSHKHGVWTGDSPGYHGEGQIWCGLLPRAFASSWPSIASIMIYQVRKDTGSTVKSFYGNVVGAFWAAVNLQLLNLIFPQGPRPGSLDMVVVWADILLLIGAAMISTADLWTRKFFLVYHISFVMAFINPKVGFSRGSQRTMLFRGIDEVTVKVFVILFISAICSVLTTIIPKPLLNISHVQSESKSSVDATCDLFEDGCDLFARKVGSAKRFQLKSTAYKFGKKAQSVKNNLELAWWETFNFGNTHRLRMLYQFLDDCICGQNAQFFLLDFGTNIENLRFDIKDKEDFADSVIESLQDLQSDTRELLNVCSDICEDGVIDEAERIELEAKRIELDKSQIEMVNQYRNYMQSQSEGRLSCQQCQDGQDLRHEAAFVSAVSRWSERVKSLSGALKDWEPPKPEGFFSKVKGLGNTCAARIEGAFDSSKMFDRINLGIAARNSAALVGALLAGRFFSWGNLFFPHDTSMPIALCLLINDTPGAQVKAGFNRMLGITLGNLIPMLTVAGLTAEVLYEQPLLRVPLHFAMIVIFTSVFTYLAYSSKNYDMVGLFSAGFGMSRVFGNCKLFEKEIGGAAEGLSTDELQRAYRALLLLSLVIVWQGATGAIGRLFHEKSSRKTAIENIEEVCRLIQENMKDFFAETSDDAESSTSGKLAKVDLMCKAIGDARDVLPLLDPASEVAPGMKSDFKVDLYHEALKEFSSINASFQTLVEVCCNDYSCCTPSKPSSRRTSVMRKDFMKELRCLKGNEGQELWPLLREEVTTKVRECCEVFLEVIRQSTEMEKASDLLSQAENQKSDDVSARLTASEIFQIFAEKAAGEKQEDVPGVYADVSARALTASAAIYTIISHAVRIEEHCVRAHVERKGL